MSCPSPYHIDPSLGMCVEPTPPGFTYVNGRFVRSCPPGMTMNDQGVCIRPVMTRKSFVNEASIQNTTLAVAATTVDGSSGGVVFAQYDSGARDLSFTNYVDASGRTTQIQNINEDIFLVGLSEVSNNYASGPNSSGSVPFPGLLAGRPSVSSMIDTRATVNNIDTMPDSVFKVEQTDGGPAGQAYFLGAPRNKIFLSNFSASSVQSPVGITFDFTNPAYSVAGNTDPYYVGAYGTFDVDENNNIVTKTVGEMETGLDVAPYYTGSTAYAASRPADPVPALFNNVSDVSSRGFQDQTFADTSYGYIIGGLANQPLVATNQGSVRAVRFLVNDPNVQNGLRPALQSLTTVSLPGPTTGDVRIARFDVEMPEPETLYVFGSVGPSQSYAPVLSFSTESHVYATTGAASAYNGISWNDLGPTNNRATMSSMAVTGQDGGLQGQGISAWSFDPVSQSLAFAISESGDPQVSATATGSTAPTGFMRKTTVFDHTGGLQTYNIPTNCVDLEVHIWGAGGSSDNMDGTGGAGAYVHGHILFDEWKSLETLDVMVGSGFMSNGLIGAGSGGVGSRNGSGGKGGGRSAILRSGMDIVTAGGGGGSTGAGQGGAASGTEEVAESGFPDANGGQGASSYKAGRGGHVYGDSRFKKAADGAMGVGAPSAWTLNRKAVGGGGGGGGYFGGGAGGFLGYTGDPSDVSTGGGGGSSYTEKLVGVRGISGIRDEPPFQRSQYYLSGIAEGGNKTNGGHGGHGRVVVIATTSNTAVNRLTGSRQLPSSWSSTSTMGDQIWVSKPAAFLTMSAADYGTGTPPDWTNKFTKAVIPADARGAGTPENSIAAIFTGLNGLVVVVTKSTDGSVYGTDATGAYTHIWWGFMGTDGTLPILRNTGTIAAFGPLTSDIGDIEPLKNVRSIRAIDSSNGSRDLVFVGDGVRIVSAPQSGSASAAWSNPRWVQDGVNGQPIDATMALVDAQYDASTTQVIMVGRPKQLDISTIVSSPWCPMFASFYDDTDVPTEVIPYVGWPTGALTGSPARLACISSTASAVGAGSVTNLGSWKGLTLNGYTGTFSNLAPNTLLLAKVSARSDYVALNFYEESQALTKSTISTTGTETAATTIAAGLTKSLQDALSTQFSSNPVSVVISPDNTISITFTGITEVNDNIQLAFTTSVLSASNYAALFGTTNSAVVDEALAATQMLLGFAQPSINGTLAQISTNVFASSFMGDNEILFQSSSTGSSVAALTPLCVPLSVNAAIEGSLYHVYAPVPKLASNSDVIVSVGGPIASPSSMTSLATQQPVPFTGASVYLDFAGVQQGANKVWKWTLFDSNNTILAPTTQAPTILDALTEPIRSGANVLASIDTGSSYGYVESFLGTYLTAMGSHPASAYALTGLDAYHVVPGGNGVKTAVGPAIMRDIGPNGSSGILNAMVSQFNDLKWYPNPDTESATPGFFLAVGQFLWELNAMVSEDVVWSTAYTNLSGVVWVSLDGLCWTTVPMQATAATVKGSTEPELFWMVYRTDSIDGTLASLVTDIGLYVWNIADLLKTVQGVFAKAPVLDFTKGPFMSLTPAGRTGPYQAFCTSRDATGTCIKCENGAQPITLPQITGPGGDIQPNFDACIAQPDNNNGQGQGGYTSVESAVDSFAIAAYAGYDVAGGPNPAYVKGLLQSFHDEEGTNSLIICPKSTDPGSTPANVVGPHASVGLSMQCALDPAMTNTVSGPDGAPTSGGLVVRRPGTSSAPDASYTGSSQMVNYVNEYRHLALVPYDTYGSSTGKPVQLPDVCPSTLGVGGSTVPPPTLGGEASYGRASKIEVTNLAAYAATPSGTPLAGPFYENESLGTQGAGWLPSNGPQDRAVLVNEDDTLTTFGYAKQNSLRYDPGGVGGSYQSKNPYLYRLSSFQFPYDGVATEGGQPALTPGRDPQVFEPGFGPLVKYMGPPGNMGFDVEYNSASTPWPANPLPEEGFGHWFVRPDATGTYAVMQGGLGYGTLLLSPTGPANGPSGGTLFNYDESDPSSYLTSGWTQYLPYSGSNVLVGPTNAARLAQVQSSVQNMIALRLKGQTPETIFGGLVNNWKSLVTTNFFRPRNWAFAGLLLDPTTGAPLGLMNANGVPQQVLVSDQPNSVGQYEFLVPDPYFAPSPVGPSIVGLPLETYTSSGTPGRDYDSISKAFYAGGAVPQGLSFINVAPDAWANIVQQHRGFHYWTVNDRQTATLDVYLDAGRFLGGTSSWFTTPSAVATPVNSNTIQQALSSLPQTPARDLLIDYVGNPTKFFAWTDPAAQTTRTLAAMMQEGLPVTLTAIDAIVAVGLAAEASRRGTRSLPINSEEFGSTDDAACYVHHRYTVTYNVTGKPLAQQLLQSNLNSLCLFGQDSTLAPEDIGFVPAADPRGESYTAGTNFTIPPTAINISISDYDVEANNAPVFAGVGPSVRQDLLAQTPADMAPNAASYGDPVWGFGLRIDPTAVVVAEGPADATTAADLPADHGYLSMVRTIVDGHERYSRPTTGSSIDAFPHANRLTYMTRYVPSVLQAYGATVPMAPMRTFTTQEFNGHQMTLNPFRPRLNYCQEGVPLIPWIRTTGNAYLYNYTTVRGRIWRAIKATDFDLEAPGFWGRQALPYTPQADGLFFGPSGTPKPTIYNQQPIQASLEAPNVPLAGYHGIAGNSRVLLDNGASLPTVNVRGIAAYATAARAGPNNDTTYATYLTGAGSGNAVFGQMLMNLNDLAASTGQVRFEIYFTSTKNQFFTNIDSFRAIKKSTTLGNLYTSFILPAYNASFTQQPAAGQPRLVTHGELCNIVSTGLNNWAQTINLPINCLVSFNVVFNPATDRPSITVNFTNNNTPTPTFLKIYSFRMYIAEPLGNWLGLRPVVMPMFDIRQLGAPTSIAVNQRYHYQRVANDDNTNDMGALSVNGLKLWNDLDYTADIPNWSGTQWISALEVNLALQPACMAISVQSQGYGSWLSNQGPPFPANPYVNATDPMNTFLWQGSSSLYGYSQAKETSVTVFMEFPQQPLANWFAGGSQTNQVAYMTGSTRSNGSINHNYGASWRATGGTGTFAYAAKATIWDPVARAWRYKNAGTVSPNGGTPSNVGWTSTGWVDPAGDSPPLYSFVYEGCNMEFGSPSVSLTFNGRQGFNESGLLMNDGFAMCDITNVTWTTKLAASISPYYWGLGLPSAVSLATSITGVYHAAAELVVSDTLQNTLPLSFFMTGATTGTIITQSPSLTNGPLGPRNSFLATAPLLPALEVPCSYGGQGRPLNYDTSNTGPPSIDMIAALGCSDILSLPANRNNAIFGTRVTYGAYGSASSAALGSIDAPYMLGPILSAPTAGPSGSPNVWPSALLTPPTPTCATGLAKVNTVTDANGSTTYLVTSECYLNVGPMTPETAPNATRLAVWVFNYRDLFVGSPPSISSVLAFGNIDMTTLYRTYLQGEPYSMDELYDSNAPYSSLGRSIRISAATMSSVGQPLSPSATEPVVVIVAPAATSDSLGTNNTITDLMTTYSNSLVYNFTGAHGPQAKYTMAFTTDDDGPAWTFYGLDNSATVTASTLKASNVTSSATNTPMTRKVYKDWNNNESQMLGLDVRQVYPSSTMMLSSDLTPATFNVVTYETPNWSSALPKTCAWLPLAGTWSNDTVGRTLYPRYTAIQAVPNYDGLSVMVADWPSPMNVSDLVNVAVDRNIAPQARPKTYDNPFLISTPNFYRPSSLFVLLCDVWRNSLRAPQKVPTNSAVPPGLPTIDYFDCMGLADYDSTNAANVEYFGVCSAGPIPQKPGLSNGWSSTAWTAAGALWNPFTGGPSWNAFMVPGATPPPDTSTDFGPNLWYPTYRWRLGNTDSGNVWPTSVATNTTLQGAKQVLFTCTDGTIRKMSMVSTGATPYAVVDSTGTTSFYNTDVNTSTMANRSYTNPGRLYNLTWWASNWWCTADNAAVWTTAPLDDANRTPINDPVVVNEFVASVIQFRPLAVSEGAPSSWASSIWPNNLAHKYNIMKVLEFEGQSALFVGSVDGEYIVITSTGTAGPYKAVTPNSDPNPWLFVPPQAQGITEAMIYVTDIAVQGSSFVVGSAPLALNPLDVSDVPWWSGAPDGLPLLSLAYSPPTADSAYVDLLAGNTTIAGTPTWLTSLRTSNVITTMTNLDYSVPLGLSSVVLLDVVKTFATDMTTDLLGQAEQAATMTVSTSTKDILTYNKRVLATGLQRLLQPAWTQAVPKICDNGLSWLPSSANLSSANVNVGYGMQNSLTGITNVGSIQFGIQVLEDLFTDLTPAGVPAFFQAGFDMDRKTRAFFMIGDSPTSGPQTGLKSFVTSTVMAEQWAPTTNIASQGFRNVLVRNTQNTTPMWVNSVAYQANLRSVNNGSLGGTVLAPLNGPMETYVKEGALFTAVDLADLNMYVNSLVTRTSPLMANLAIGDMAYGSAVQTMAWSTYGAYAPTALSLGTLQSDGSLVVMSPTSDFVQQVEPQFTGPAVMAWSPYEMKFYAAGTGLHVPDWAQGTEQELIRPKGISEGAWDSANWESKGAQPTPATQSRLLIVSADCATGSTYPTDDEGIVGVPFTQVYEVTKKVGESVSLRTVSKNFTTVECFGFSPNITAIGGSVVTNATSDPPKSSAVVMWRTNVKPAGNDLAANWSKLDLGVSGTVTAMKFVGYAWYIATWDPYANYQDSTQQYEGASTLFFASINFGVVSPVDAWNTGMNVSRKVSSMDIAVASQQKGVCATGYEPDPTNPNMCVKKCPQGYTAYGTLCVQTCPAPYTETSTPNECAPDSRPARTVSPTVQGAPPYSSAPKTGPTSGSIKSMNYTETAVISSVVLLCLLLVVGILIQFRKR